jgi:amino acid adenylation domain-containing protein
VTPYLLHQLLADSAARHPEREAVVFQDRSMRYAELDQRSGRLASALAGLGVTPGDRVGIHMNKSIDSLVFLFGILKAGAAYVPIDYLAPPGRLEYIVNNCEIRVLFTTPGRAKDLLPILGADSPLQTILLPGTAAGPAPEIPGNRRVLWVEELSPSRETAGKPIDLSDTTPAYILHTSGSTGMPKGVGLSHLNALTFVNMASEYFGIGKEDRFACHAPLQFDLTVFDIFVAVQKGATIVLVPESLSVFPVKLAQFIDDSGITVWNSVASVLSLLAERGRIDRFRFESLRTVIFSGDILPVKYLRMLRQYMPAARLFNVYGQTEANSSTCYEVLGIPGGDGWKIPIGKAFPNFEVFALGENGEIARRPGEIGELHVRSSSVAAGYWRDEGRTAEVFVTDPGSFLANRKVYRTGDLVTLDAEGNYVFLGRKDQQVKSRGYRVQLNEIETVLNNHPSIKEAVVVALPDELLGNRIVSHVAAVEGRELTAMEVSEYCNRILPLYMLPEKFVFHERLPKTPTGKTDRKLLKESSLAG